MRAGFTAEAIETDDTRIFVCWAGIGPPLLLLHGFPQTHLMWREVAPRLAHRFMVICPDLRGYGRSGCPASRPDHAPEAKRAMAQDMVSVMAKLGFESFSVAGHDRGARVAYRLALDHTKRVERLAVLDIVPTAEVWERADKRFACAYWPWSLLAQPEPLPEQLIVAASEAIIDDALGWGSRSTAVSPEVRAAYIAARSCARARHLRGVSSGRNPRPRARCGGPKSRASDQVPNARSVEWSRAAEHVVRRVGWSPRLVAAVGR